MKSHPQFLCPYCGEFGFLTKRWVESSYYPKYACYYLLVADYYGRRSSKVRGSRFRGQSKKHLFYNYSDEQDKTDWYRVTYGRYKHNYIGHYDAGKYKEQMNDYKSGKRKSRPNGRRWCHLPSDLKFYRSNTYYVPYTELTLRLGKLCRYSLK